MVKKEEKKEVKLYKKIIDKLITIVLVFFILNSFYAYYSYKKLCDGKKPIVYINSVKSENKTKYNLLFYNLTEDMLDNNRTVVLKLFFFK